ncbi:MAG TPA: hypothetical protein PLY16_02710 [Candidatus Saccharibacteria bacterium]|nr:hypothetical protein [Candidatus Saccharibacteria bacterium]
MTKDELKEAFGLVIKKRYVAVLSAALVLITLAFIVSVFIMVTPSDLQLITQYSAFGDVHLYRNQWVYLLSFALFGFMLLALHIVLAAKILLLKGESLAVSFLWLSLGLVIFAWAIGASIINVW